MAVLKATNPLPEDSYCALSCVVSRSLPNSCAMHSSVEAYLLYLSSTDPL